MKKFLSIFLIFILSLNIPAVNADEYDVININDWVGSYCYWDTDYINTSSQKYQNVTLTSKNNTIETPRFDYTNKNRPTWLCLNKSGTVNDDCYMDINTATRGWQVLQGNQTYKYFSLEGDFYISGNSDMIRFPMLRDSVSGSSNINALTADIAGNNLNLSNGTVLKDVIPTGEWFHYAIGINLENQTFSVYVNEDVKKENIPLPTTIKALSMMRICLDYGYWAGSFKMDNVKVCGYEKPYVYGEDCTTSIFYDDTPVYEFLKDKIAFHAYGKTMIVNGTKYNLDDNLRFDEENSQLYVKKTAIADKVDWDLTGCADEINIKSYINSKGMYLYENGIGLFVITKDRALNFDETNEYKWFLLKPYNQNRVEHTTQLEALNDYVMFDRPTAATLSQKMKNINTHPRIIADKSVFDECRMLYKNDVSYKALADKFLEKTDTILNAPARDYVFDDTYRMNTNFAYILDRMTRLGFAYQLTGEQKYANRAYVEFESMFAFPDINPSHTVDTGLINKAIAIGFDWMYNGFTEEQRKKIAEFALNICIKPVADGFYGMASAASDATSGFQALKSTTNYNAWVVGGLFQNVMAIMEYNEEYLFDIAEKCIRSLEYTVKGLAPDGAWIESPTYLNVVLEYLMPYGLTSRICFDDDFNIMEYDGVSQAGEWLSSIIGVLGVNQMGDSHPMPVTNTNYMYINAYYGNPELASLRKYYLLNKNADVDTPDLLYYDKSASGDYENLPKAVMTKGIESLGIRESYTDENGLFLSAHGGANTGYHMHYDTGSFIFDINGVRWAHDIGQENYNIGLSDYQIYRKRSEAHNTVTINNSASKESMTEDGYAPIIRFEGNEHSAIAVYDMSDVYYDASNYYRGFYVGDNRRSLTIKDEITVNKRSEVYWFMNTKAAVSIKGNEAILTQDGKKVSVQIACNTSDYEFGVMAAEPLETLPAGSTGQSANSEYQKLYIKANVSSDTELEITAKLSAYGEKSYYSGVNTKKTDTWTLEEYKTYELKNGIPETTGPYKDMWNIVGASGGYSLLNEPGLGGKAEDDTSIIYSNTTNTLDKSVYTDFWTITDKPFFAEYSILPNAGAGDGTQFHFFDIVNSVNLQSGLLRIYGSGDVYVKGQYKTKISPEKWNRVAISVIPYAKKFKIFINGSLIYDGTTVINDVSRIRLAMCSMVPAMAAVDDIKITKGKAVFEVSSIKLFSNTSKISINNTLSLITVTEPFISVAELTEICAGNGYSDARLFTDATYKVLSDVVNDGNVLVVSNGDGIYKYYTVRMPEFYINYSEEEGTKTRVFLYNNSDKSPSGKNLLVAKYTNGMLSELDSAVFKDEASISAAVSNCESDNEKIKIFIWNSSDSVMPLYPVKELN